MAEKMNDKDKKIIFKIENLKKYFPIKKPSIFAPQRYVHANERISLDIYEGETLGLVGESGCGKSTLGRTIIQLHSQTEGNTLYYGRTVSDFAPSYVNKIVGSLDRLYPEYLKAMKELEDLNSQKVVHEEVGIDFKKEIALTREEVKAIKIEENEDVKAFELEDKIIAKRREIQNKYLNMVRLAGGLLTYENLSEVSKVLSAQNNVRRERAKVIANIDSLLLKISDSEYAKKADSLTEELKKQKTKLEEIEKRLEKADSDVESLRDKCKGNEGFEDLERQRDDGIDLSNLKDDELRELRKELQIIFQDPYSSLDTKHTVGNIIGEGVLAHNMFKSNKSEGYNEYIKKVMKQCGLAEYFIHRYPHQFSGGQRQRIGIARALALKPKFIVCDEAVSALDVSIQSQVINLLQELKEDHKLTYLFITHDLSVVKYISDRIAVMYLGEVVELADSDDIFNNPSHPYTRSLLNAIPRTDTESKQEISILEGDIPSAVNPPKGCRFHTRCKYAMPRCKQFSPELQKVEENHMAACHLLDLSDEDRKKFVKSRDDAELASMKKEFEEDKEKFSKL